MTQPTSQVRVLEEMTVASSVLQTGGLLNVLILLIVLISICIDIDHIVFDFIDLDCIIATEERVFMSTFWMQRWMGSRVSRMARLARF